MPTATLLIEIVIIGLFANLNLVLFVGFISPSVFVPLRSSTLFQSEGTATLLLFVAALVSYVIGVIVNVVASNLFDPVDDVIRERTLDGYRADLGKVDSWVNGEKRRASDIYHYMRYRLYAQGATMKEQLDQHRSEIRILRATAFNSYWLMVVLLADPSWLTVLPALAALIFLTGWNLPLPKMTALVHWKETHKEPVCRLYHWIFAAGILWPWVVIGLWGSPGIWWRAGLAAAVVAVSAYVLWMKQQKRFYQALFHGFRALATQTQTA